MSSQRNVPPNFRPDKITFLGRNEQLDWKKIASIDIDDLIHKGDTSQLLELIKPVTFCKADTEFDDGKIRVDPAFIKVFRISQLISELLLASHEKSMERLADLQEKHNETEKEKEKLSEEILHLKETLTSAKKELKKRKEMLATTQNEMLGENNGDEYDQCPYCSKKFLGPGFLLAHIQRRHQGLPANPLYSSYPSGSASVVYHPQTPQAPHHHRHSHQQTPGNGIYDPHNIALPQTAQHVQTLMNHHQLFPAGPTPSPSLLYNSNNQLLPSNLSFSGSVTSLNNIPFNQNQGPATTSNISLAFGKRESFTQTAILTNAEKHAEIKKSSSQLELLPEEAQTTQRQQRAEEESSHSSDKHSPDSLNQLPSSLRRESPLQGETLQRPQQLPPPSPLPTKSVDGSHPTTDGDGDAAGVVNTSMLRNWERVEAKKMDVIRVQNQHEAHWSNMEEEKVRQNGTDRVTNAMISETLQGTAGFSINSSQSHLREDGEVTKAAADVATTDSQYVGEREKEFAELKKLLQASVQGELKSLISRLETQEQYWQDKLASLQQDHERQIQQLRHEVQIQNGTRRSNSDNGAVMDENGVVMVDDNFQREREIGDGEIENGKIIAESYSGRSPPPSGIILVEPRNGHHNMPQSLHEHHHHHQQQQQLGSSSQTGALRDALYDQEDDEDAGESFNSTRVPVAKPRKSKVVAAAELEGKHHQQYHHQQQQQREEMSHGGIALAQLESLSESDPELLAIIQPEEFHEGKHDNSIVPNSNDVSGGTSTSATTARVAVTTTNNIKSRPQYQQHPLSSSRSLPAANSGLVTTGSRGAEAETAPTFPASSEIKSDDEVSEYTLSDSVDLNDDDELNNDIRAVSSSYRNDKQKKQHQQHLDFSNHPRGKYAVKQMPAKKRYVFDAEARKIVEVSPDDGDGTQDGEGDEYSENIAGDLNSTSSDDDEFTEGRKKRTSQLDLVRAKTIIELEQNMSDIGLNPESTAIGMEEMKRALKHFKSQQRATSNDQIHDYEKLEEERNAVKNLAKFEAVKSSIDEKLDAISTLSSKKSQQSSFVKMLTAVKSSGKSFGKRVASAVKKKHKSDEHDSDDNNKKGGKEKRKRKPSSAPATKATFFSKARWTNKKKAEGSSSKQGAAASTSTVSKGKKTGKEETENASDMSSSEESGEEIELPPFMQRSNINDHHRPQRRGSSSRSSERRASSSGPSRHNSARSSTRRKRSNSRPKSAKPLKRLNSNATNKSTPTHQPKSSAAAVTSVGINSSESSPFSNVDECDHEDDDVDCEQSISTNSSISNESNNRVENNERVELFGNHPKNKTQEQNQRCKESVRDSANQRRQQESISDEDDDHDHKMDDELKRKEIIGVRTTGRKKFCDEDGEERRRVEDLVSSSCSSSNAGESQSEDWDEEEASFATSNEILANVKSSEVISVESHAAAAGKSNLEQRKDKRWKNEMTDSRLQQIKQYVNKSKKEVTGDETSFSEEESEDELLERKGKAAEQTKQSGESKQNYPRERKLAFAENNSGKLAHGKVQLDSNNERQQRWAATIHMEEGIKQSQQQLQPRGELPVPSRYISPGQINPNTQSGSKTTPLFSEPSSERKRFQFTDSINDSEWSNGDRRTAIANETSTFSSTKNEGNRQSRFLTSTPKRASSAMKSGQGETASQQQFQNSFDDMNDLDDLLNTNTTLSDEEMTEEKQQQQEKNDSTDNGNRNQQFVSEVASFKRKPLASGMIMQPTNHHHLLSRGLGMTNLKSKAETQSKLLFDVGKGRGSPTSRNSWDSQK